MWWSIALKGYGFLRTALQAYGKWIALAVVLGACAFWLRHSGYTAGYADCEEKYQAAVAQAGTKFREELAARDKTIAEAQGRVIEVVKWRERVRTVYEHQVQTDPDCRAWSLEPVRCDLAGLQGGAHPGGAVPPAP